MWCKFSTAKLKASLLINLDSRKDGHLKNKIVEQSRQRFECKLSTAKLKASLLINLDSRKEGHLNKYDIAGAETIFSKIKGVVAQSTFELKFAESHFFPVR